MSQVFPLYDSFSRAVGHTLAVLVGEVAERSGVDEGGIQSPLIGEKKVIVTSKGIQADC